MRIIGGRLRGKKLEWVSDNLTRPTTDRVKENIFNILANSFNFENASVLDLFAGTGQMGLECESRGSKEVIYNEIRAELREKMALNGVKSGVFGLDFDVFLHKFGTKKFDIVFLDPPYQRSDFAISAVKTICENKMLKPNGIIVVESEIGDLDFENLGFNLVVDKRKYGRANIYFVHIMN